MVTIIAPRVLQIQMADVILFLIITIITILTALYIHSKTKVVRTMIFNIQREINIYFSSQEILWKGIKQQMS